MNKNQSHFITKAWTWRGEKALTGRNERQIGHNRPMSSKPPTRPDWKLLLRMTRPGFLAITAVACLLGLATAATGERPIDWPTALLTLGLALAAHAGANVLNDYHDALNGADAANRNGLFPFTGGSRLIQQGRVTPQQTLALARWLLAGVTLGGLLLAWATGGGLLLVGLAGLALGWAYSAPPLKLMSRGLGELAVALAWGLIVVGADYVQRQQFLPLPALAALGYALLMANILLVNGLPDAASDARVGKRTLAVRLGARGSARLYLLIALLAHGWLVLAGLQLLPLATLWGLLGLPLSLAAAWWLWRQAEQPAGLRPAILLTIGAGLVHGLGTAAGLARLGGQ